jgi:hypothetical protein
MFLAVLLGLGKSEKCRVRFSREILSMGIRYLHVRIDLTGATALTIVGALDPEIKT